MDTDESDMSSVPIDTVKDDTASDVCKVCGINTVFMYLGVKCCAPCKMFFRRNANFDLNTHQCTFDGNCDVTINSRSACRFCRFKKCLSVGLQPDLIRASSSRPDHARKKHQQQITTDVPGANSVSLPAVIPTLDLLHNDRSLLTINQWSLLSNVINAVNDQSPTSMIIDTMARQSAYPSKLRLKIAIDHLKQITGALYLSAGPFMKTMPEFMNMSINDQSALVERNIRCVGGFSGILVLRDADVCTNPYYHNASISMYGSELTHQATRIVSNADIDGTLIKLMLSVLAMSTCSDHIDLNPENDGSSNITPGGTRLFSNTLSLLQIQNVYVEMIFKYMLYRYGYNEAVLRFASLIKSCLEQNRMVSGDGYLRQHDEMVQKITEQTERSLTLGDEPIE